MNIELEMKIDEDENEVPDSKTKLMEALTSGDRHEVLFSPETSHLYSSTRPEASYSYDYEVNDIRFGEENEREYMYIKTTNKLLGDKYVKIFPERDLYDSLNMPYSGDPNVLNNGQGADLAKANIFKRLVSKKKRRTQTPLFDLDLAYITERIIGMGFPATGCETLYRNSLTDLRQFLDRYHGEYKIYNLCIEQGRIYQKNLWFDRKVGLFPFNDHAPCPIKLILDFCVDICLYLTCNPRGVAAIHCKAGKGRTGVMIVCYLIFSGLCDTSDQALAHYAKQRTLNNRGVTIPSQIRYIKYFETYLNANFQKPFLNCIPKIIKYELNRGYSNLIINYNTDMSYFSTINGFKLKKCLIGPFSQEMQFRYDFSAITIKKLNFSQSKMTQKIIEGQYFYEIELNSDDVIDYDLKLTITSKKLKFYSWFNLWFNTFEIISKFILKHNCFSDSASKETNINTALSKEKETEITFASKRTSKDGGLVSLIHKQYMKGINKKKLSTALSRVIAKYKAGKNQKSAIKTLKKNKDLNNILDGIDQLALSKKVIPLIRSDLSFEIERGSLDKLKTKIRDNFKVKFTYELLSNKNE